MKIHEYQAKELLKKFGVALPAGRVASTVSEAKSTAEEIGLPVVVKAQIHAGGRGKGGGIKVAKTSSEVESISKTILGMNLVTPQTGPEGKKVKKVLIEKATQIKKEFYLGVVVDRAKSRFVMMASSEGGVEIEEVAARSPEKIFKTWVDPTVGLQGFQTRQLAFQLGLQGDAIKKFGNLALALYRFCVGSDASLVEINPMVLTQDGDLLALDCKVNLDDNALFRHPDLAKLLDPDEEDPNELEAKEHGLNYISLNGNIGCLVNGAGLAMATMDIIKLAGGEPCNFLDVGGGASQESVTEAFKIILRNTKVKAIFVNIFGGILRCDILANGIVAAAKELGVKVPLVVRLLGTNVELGKEILKKSGLNIISEDDFAMAAKKVVEVAR
ncbi:MAG: succinate--CoA ligase subunit beta [Deltaproteobacteria bacterium RIFCSPLOWO2_01_44_7]|nr:MAG: succinate--CoA ligase subunit beta [Deltaproteobacteria bacterium RIFCSPHIGHO2_01_FULL_43_49]OGQ14659.1 MAG: succinate--CoA ligase subunit beta [Deltaproteobacteria bacterium RIFCSPHIGHO2_02_FULL_44_53]OGQ28045.1 MAG: succinate--CoA ligase subunit beta [Deltaproteobacteria bacterium RIFCSPHIGHO2_12_FULL_44_21]OGQ31257.1 MAG: succinate--CoA ligase subunit beta [Deltaproteobacteria bacterium RIFCSPLOWO2_01_FULL_45_74]OGQ41476.1 MAG: succinate--CoA ligase subunit beta [Deltaproteobacteria 